MAVFVVKGYVYVKKNDIVFDDVVGFVLTGCSKHNETSEDNDTLTQIKKRGELIVGVKYDSNLLDL